jgi:hypothetical protein
MKLLRAAIVLSKVLGVLVVITILATTIFTSVCKRRVEAQIAAIKAKGQPVTVADLMVRRIPPSANGATYYDRASKLISETPPAGTPRTRQDLLEYTRLINMTPEELAKRPDLLKAARKAIYQNAKGLALVREAVKHPTYWRHDFRPGDIEDYAAAGRYGNLRSITRLLAEKAVIAAHDDNMDQATRCVGLALKVSGSLDSDTGIFPFLVKAATLRITTTTIRTVASYHALNEKQARRLFDAISAVGVDRSFTHAIETERVVGLHVFRSMPAFLMYLDEGTYLDTITKQLDAVSLTYNEASKRLTVAEKAIPNYAIMARIISPVFSKMSLNRYFIAADLAETQVLLATQAYRSKFGSYPTSIDDLGKRLGWKLPADPFNGNDLVYKPAPNGFLVYSVGPDMKDNGGRIDVDRRQQARSKGDIVLRWKR